MSDNKNTDTSALDAMMDSIPGMAESRARFQESTTHKQLLSLQEQMPGMAEARQKFAAIVSGGEKPTVAQTFNAKSSPDYFSDKPKAFWDKVQKMEDKLAKKQSGSSFLSGLKHGIGDALHSLTSFGRRAAAPVVLAAATLTSGLAVDKSLTASGAQATSNKTTSAETVRASAATGVPYEMQSQNLAPEVEMQSAASALRAGTTRTAFVAPHAPQTAKTNPAAAQSDTGIADTNFPGMVQTGAYTVQQGQIVDKVGEGKLTNGLNIGADGSATEGAVKVFEMPKAPRGPGGPGGR